MRQASGLILVLALGIAGEAEQEATDKNKAPDYYPLKPGTTWSYEVNSDGQKTKLKSRVAKFETFDGKPVALVEMVIDGMVNSTMHMVTTDKGVFRHRVNGVELAPPVCVLKYPFKKNETWETETIVGSEKLTVKARAVDSEEVTVPAGTYKALKSVVDTTFNGQQSRFTYWFAPDVGVVKQTIVSDGKEISLELEKFEASK